MRSRVHVHVLCWRWRRRRRAQLEVAHPCVGVVDGEQLTTGMQLLRSGLLRGHGAMARRIHNARCQRERRPRPLLLQHADPGLRAGDLERARKVFDGMFFGQL